MKLADYNPLAIQFDNHLWLLFSALGTTLVALYIALQLFLHTWFAYLKHVAGDYRSEIERRLASYLNIGAFEPQYSKVRRRVFGSDDES